MFRIDHAIQPWKDAGALNAQLSLYGFWNDHIFLTKSGDVGIVLRMRGVDYESLDNAAQEYAVKRLEAALKTFGPGFHIYQYLFKTNRPKIPFASYDDPVVQSAVDQREQFFAERRDQLYEIEIFYAIVLEGARSKTGIKAGLSMLLADPRGAAQELYAQLSGSTRKRLLRRQIENDCIRLEQCANSFVKQISDFVEIEVLGNEESFRFFRKLMNFEPWRIEGKHQSTQYLDYQVVNSSLEADRNHLRVGDHYVRLLTMKESITQTKPMVLKGLLQIPANFFVVTEWLPLEQHEARAQVMKRKRHFNASKTSWTPPLHQGAEYHDPRNVLIDESKQGDIENLGDCLRRLGEGQYLGEFSFTLVLYDRDLAVIDRVTPDFVRIFTAADGTLVPESYNQLNAFFAAVPGNYRENLRRMYLFNSNYADLSFLFTIHTGEKWNQHLRAEYLAVLETDNATPYYLNLHHGEVAHTLITGKIGSGKTFTAGFLLENTQKYQPFTTIFDIRDSYESLTRIFDGSYMTVGQESRDFTINPFCLENTKANLQFLYAFVTVLLGADHHPLDFAEQRQLYSAIERVYVLDRDQRTLSNFAEIIGPLKERLYRWTRAGQYGHLFDNPEDTLTFRRFQTFSFPDWKDAEDILEPLLFYVLHRANNQITDKKYLTTFKVFLLDEAWLFFRNKTIRAYIREAMKTWRSHNAAMILATQSLKELADSDLLSTIQEQCATKIFLANPDMDRDMYREAFQLNDTELQLISELNPPGQMLIRKPGGSKKVQLNVDSLSYWMASSSAHDRALRYEYFDRYGVTEGLRRLAKKHPFPNHAPITPVSACQKEA